jgi:hypothetical protein
MAIPKIKKTLPLTYPPIGYERRLELLEDINKDGTYLPKSILHEDLDRGFLDFVKDDLKTVVGGKIVKVVDILMTTQNWAQFTQTWDFNNIDKNVEPPIITTVRTPEVKYGTLPSLKYTIPNRKQFYYAAVPTWDGQRKGMDIYTIPQPVPVDIKYSVKIICNRMRELNKFNQIVIEKFSSRQAYTKIKGHYIPITLDDISDESVMDVEKRRYYIQSYGFTLQGFLSDEEEYQVKPAISRSLLLIEMDNRKKKIRKNVNPPNPDQYVFNANYPVGTTVYTQTFDYTANIKIDGSENVTSYEIYINGLYYGDSSTPLSTGYIQINSGDELTLNIVKTNGSIISTINLVSIIL